jgi:hypothetical protein
MQHLEGSGTPVLYIDRTVLNLQESCVLYIGRAYRYPPDVAFHIFFQQL